MKHKLAAVVMALSFLAFAQIDRAAAQDEFFRGKTLRLLADCPQEAAMTYSACR